MDVINKGQGTPEHAVVAAIHGDEPSGKMAVERFLNSNYELEEPVKFVIANEEALEQNERYLDADLNRSFPGNPQSDKHEEGLAYRIQKELEGLKVLDIHSTRSEPTPFITTPKLDQETLERMSLTGVEKVCYFEESGDVLGEVVDAFIVEVGPQGTEEAADMAYEILVNYLAALGIIEEEFEQAETEIYKFYEKVEGGDWEFLKKNFQKVEKGEVFARKGTTELISTEEFYPILMSSDGYENMLGNKAKRIQNIKNIF